jgi:hypothetical protein
MSKILIELEVDLGENKNEEMNSLAASLCLFLAPRTTGFKYLTSRIIDGCDGAKTIPTLHYDPRQ